MEETLELKEEYPKLVIQNDEEAFDLDAMKRAEILIEGTRDGIMSGVKKRIESHMIHFLPALTDDRYNMARIDEKDYRIEIVTRGNTPPQCPGGYPHAPKNWRTTA